MIETFQTLLSDHPIPTILLSVLALAFIFAPLFKKKPPGKYLDFQEANGILRSTSKKDSIRVVLKPRQGATDVSESEIVIRPGENVQVPAGLEPAYAKYV